MTPTSASVIISTYNKVDWLGKCLLGFAAQSRDDFEIVIADDGSSEATRDRIDEIRSRTGMSIRHVWHADEGFRKTVILNKAILASESDYLIFTDGDCIPRRDFVDTHLRQRERGAFVSGGYCKLPLDVSRSIGEAEIRGGDFADPAWLFARGLRQPASLWKLHAQGRLARVLNRLTPTKPTWNGHNASGWKDDILRVNGFDERMAYGGEDRELGERLINLGLSSIQCRYSAICVHLDHDRPWRRPELIARNKEIRRRTVGTGATWTEHGIRPDADRGDRRTGDGALARSANAD